MVATFHEVMCIEEYDHQDYSRIWPTSAAHVMQYRNGAASADDIGAGASYGGQLWENTGV